MGRKSASASPLQKNGFVFLREIYHFKPSNNIQSLIRLELGIWQTLK